MVQIAGGNTLYPYLGGVPHNVAKFQAMPTGFFECDGFQAEGGLADPVSTTRYFRGPWSKWWNFYVWAKGAAARQYPSAAAQGAGQGVITRIVPAQDPRFPHLYAAEVSIKANEGAVVQDPTIFAYAADGTYALDVNGNKIPLPSAAWVDNSQGGGYGSITNPAPPAAPVVTPPSGKYADGMVTMRVVYRRRPYHVLDDTTAAKYPGGEMARWVERKIGPSIEALPLSRLSNVVVGGPTPGVVKLVFINPPFGFDSAKQTGATIPTFWTNQQIPEPGTVILRGEQVSWVWHDVPDPNLDAIEGLMGLVNINYFDGLGPPPPGLLFPLTDINGNEIPTGGAGIAGYPTRKPGTLLFQQPEFLLLGRDILGSMLWRITIRALWKPTKWTNLPTPDGNQEPAGWAFFPATLPVGTFGPPQFLGQVYGAIDPFPAIFGPQPVINWPPG